MKIGIVCPYDIYRFGGVQEAVRAHARHLRGRGHKVTVIAPKSLVEHEPEPGIVTIGIARKVKALKTTSEVTFSANNNEIDKMLSEGKFDILHIHEPWVPLMPSQVIRRAKLKNIKMIATFHAMLPKGATAKSAEKLMRPYARPLLNKLDALVAVSSAARKNVGSMTEREIKIIPNAIEAEEYNVDKVKPHELTAGNIPTIVFVGRHEKRKGAYYLIKAVAEIEKNTSKTIRLILTGDGPLRPKLEELAIKLGLKDVHFLGFVETKDKLALLRGATVFSAPALYGESFGIVLIEAMAMGAPIVAGDNDGYKSVLTGKGSLGLIDPKDTSLYASRLELFIDDKHINKMLSQWGLEEISKYTYDKVVDQYEKLYEEVVG